MDRTIPRKPTCFRTRQAQAAIQAHAVISCSMTVHIKDWYTMSNGGRDDKVENLVSLLEFQKPPPSSPHWRQTRLFSPKPHTPCQQ